MRYLWSLSYLYNMLENLSSFIICMPMYPVYILVFYVYMYIVRGESLHPKRLGNSRHPYVLLFFLLTHPNKYLLPLTYIEMQIVVMNGLLNIMGKLCLCDFMNLWYRQG